MIRASQTVGQIATDYPPSTRVFWRHKIDFCCGGGATLGEACAKRAIDVDAVVAEIEVEVARARPDDLQAWTTRSTGELIDFIEDRYHASLRDELPRLEALARKVARVHHEVDERLIDIHREVHALRHELEAHMVKEEMILFPAMRRANHASLSAPISVMLREHDTAGEALTALRTLTDDYTARDEFCRSWRALWDGLRDLERELQEHIHLENNILFPRAFETHT